jgi:hypothetical protein
MTNRGGLSTWSGVGVPLPWMRPNFGLKLPDNAPIRNKRISNGCHLHGSDRSRGGRKLVSSLK